MKWVVAFGSCYFGAYMKFKDCFRAGITFKVLTFFLIFLSVCTHVQNCQLLCAESYLCGKILLCLLRTFTIFSKNYTTFYVKALQCPCTFYTVSVLHSQLTTYHIYTSLIPTLCSTSYGLWYFCGIVQIDRIWFMFSPIHNSVFFDGFMSVWIYSTYSLCLYQ